ncbi:cystathionine gamma-lyase [Candidatus Koribacter versatilis Ellin345]|uniref:Cystathionine gamma-lyase n=1 Tax=Koribacter versatilis (strain Ellin345) TaxID=204669 RepID=Q1INQ0_KORVE|nr:PLP-dependent aspartate aminotransferase family protein [Candidatus Koribacter versatilis]ABF41500.1 cystathionine gamma-lyase [Candidatus Koribacter versatilis Ellin345]
MAKKDSGFSTKCVHVGQEPEQLTGSVGVPIYATSTYAQDELGKPRLGYEYSRVSNPTRDRLEKNLAALEGGVDSKVFASGMAAVSAMCSLLKKGDHVVCSSNVYGGVPRLFNQVLVNYGLEFTYVDTSDLKATEKAIRRSTKYVYIETPTNPLMVLSDIEAISQIAHKKGTEVVVDNTFMSPYFQKPIALGADMVLHSTTKFLNGHSDGLGGVLVCTTKEQSEKLAFIQKSVGAIMSPFESWLILRGVKTLAVRMKQHDESGRVVADFLAKQKKIKKVFYPGLPDHPQHELAKQQMTGFGALITFETGSLNNAKKLLKRVKVCTLGESLGGVETLISHPATMTHAALGEKGRAAIGLTDGMVRISVGIEDVEDLITDLEQAISVL